MSTAKTATSTQNHEADNRLRQLVGYNMKRAYHEIQTELTAALKPLKLKVGSFAALAAIADCPGLKQSALAETLAIEQANLVALIDQLERRGLIKRERARTDRRAYALFATADGRQLCQRADIICRELEARFLADIPHSDIDQLITCIQSIEQRIKANMGTVK